MSVMHETQMAPRSSLISHTTRKPEIGLCLFVLCTLLFAEFVFPMAVSAAPRQTIPKIAVDNADISSPQTTLASLLRLTNAFHELVYEDGFTRENQGRLRNIYRQVEKLFDLREVPPKYRRHMRWSKTNMSPLALVSRRVTGADQQ